MQLLREGARFLILTSKKRPDKQDPDCEIFVVPDRGRQEERGESTPPAGWPHGSVEAALVVPIGQYVQSRKLGVVLGSSAGYDLPSGDTVEPDVSFIAARRFAAAPKPVAGKFLRIVPNLVVEILSPTTARKDRIDKKSVYERNGVDEYWIVDPARKQVTVFHRGKRGYGAGATVTTDTIRSRVLPELGLAVKDLFAF